MIELSSGQKLWLQVLLGLDEDAKHEIVKVFNACAGKSVMHSVFHPKHAQYMNGVSAINNLFLPPRQHPERRWGQP